ncbi:hypothetical protein Sango_2494900 [Sesamum angolense]|uniref:DUF4216 domain-containing protein n=1 Tax=Sesamum angolense TaxID=2727404 RepID=A0AAE1W3S7_9LAMI|nr:hypothetical protein Sango_2494900 [Sesamum angolense]
MCHSSDAEAWKHFNRMYPDFTEEPCNVRLGLCTDGRTPHGQYGLTYSCWQVIITPYNLPPVQGMKVHPSYHLVEVNFKKLYQKDDPLILAQQAVPVYFTEYPSMKRDKADWVAVCKIKSPRIVNDFKSTETVAYQPRKLYQFL